MSDVYEPTGNGRYRRALHPHPVLLLSVSRRTRQLSLIRSHGLCYGMAWRPYLSKGRKKKKKRRDTPERDVDQKKCRSIYIIINRKENLFNPAGEELISLELI